MFEFASPPFYSRNFVCTIFITVIFIKFVHMNFILYVLNFILYLIFYCTRGTYILNTWFFIVPGVRTYWILYCTWFFIVPGVRPYWILYYTYWILYALRRQGPRRAWGGTRASPRPRTRHWVGGAEKTSWLENEWILFDVSWKEWEEVTFFWLLYVAQSYP